MYRKVVIEKVHSCIILTWNYRMQCNDVIIVFVFGIFSVIKQALFYSNDVGFRVKINQTVNKQFKNNGTKVIRKIFYVLSKVNNSEGFRFVVSVVIFNHSGNWTNPLTHFYGLSFVTIIKITRFKKSFSLKVVRQ